MTDEPFVDDTYNDYLARFDHPSRPVVLRLIEIIRKQEVRVVELEAQSMPPEVVQWVLEWGYESYQEGSVDGGNEYAKREDEWLLENRAAVERVLDWKSK